MNLYAPEKLKGIDGFSVDSIYLAHNDEINYKWNIIECYRLLKMDNKNIKLSLIILVTMNLTISNY